MEREREEREGERGGGESGRERDRQKEKKEIGGGEKGERRTDKRHERIETKQGT